MDINRNGIEMQHEIVAHKSDLGSEVLTSGFFSSINLPTLEVS